MGVFRGFDPNLGAEVCFKCFVDVLKKSEAERFPKIK